MPGGFRGPLIAAVSESRIWRHRGGRLGDAMITRMTQGVLALLLVASGMQAVAADGDLDPTYGGGILRAPVATYLDFPAIAAARSDGKIVLCSVDFPSRHLFLSRFEASGRLDATFGDAGVVDTGVVIDILDIQLRMVAKADSLIVIALHTNYSHKLFLKQFGPSGAPDPGFGFNGVVMVQVYTDVDTGFDIAVTNQDKIVLAGVDMTRHETFAVKISVDGVVDPGFGVGGFAYTGVYASNGTDVAVDTSPDGIFVASIDDATGLAYAARFDWLGGLVPAFGAGGISVIDVYCGFDPTIAVEIDDTAHLYVAGRDDANHQLFVARLGAWGALDPDFGGTGIIHTGIGNGRFDSLALATQAGGKVVVAGRDPATPDFYLCRYDTLGLPDADFGQAGVARLGMVYAEEMQVALSVCADDRILLAGQDPSVAQAFAARFTADGRLDRAGLLPGRVYTGLYQPYNGRVAMSPLPDGGRLLAGIALECRYYVQRFDSTGLRVPEFWLGGSRVLEDIHTSEDAPVGIASVPGTTDFYLLGHDLYVNKLFVQRFHGDGTEDTSFGSGLPVYIDIDVDWYSDAAIIARPNGKVRVAGLLQPLHEHFLVGLLATGDLDPDFGSGGVVITDVHGSDSSRLELVPYTGGLVLAGLDQDNGQTFLMRFFGGGSLDTDFGQNGVARSGDECLGASMCEVGVALSADGPAVAGYCSNYPLNGESFVARFTPDGVLDPGFGVEGRALTGIETLSYLPIALVAQSDQKIVFFGARAADQRTFFLRFDRNGAFDPAFGSGGMVVTDLRSGYKTGLNMEILADGKLLAAGRDLDQGQDYLVRLLAAPEVGTTVPEGSVPEAVSLVRSYPNPFNPSTTLRFGVPTAGLVRIGIYDIQGRLVTTIAEENLEPGWYTRTWRGDDDHGRPVGSGVYFVRLVTAGTVRSQKVMLVR